MRFGVIPLGDPRLYLLRFEVGKVKRTPAQFKASFAIVEVIELISQPMLEREALGNRVVQKYLWVGVAV